MSILRFPSRGDLHPREEIAMDFFGVETPRDICNLLLGLGGGAGLSWIFMSLLFKFRLKRLNKEAAKAALERSRHVLKGQAAEQLAPLSGAFSYLPSDSRFLGSPIDYLVFDGLSEDQELEIVFLEVKSGKSQLTAREAKIREAVKAGRVRWEELRL